MERETAQQEVPNSLIADPAWLLCVVLSLFLVFFPTALLEHRALDQLKDLVNPWLVQLGYEPLGELTTPLVLGGLLWGITSSIVGTMWYRQASGHEQRAFFRHVVAAWIWMPVLWTLTRILGAHSTATFTAVFLLCTTAAVAVYWLVNVRRLRELRRSPES